MARVCVASRESVARGSSLGDQGVRHDALGLCTPWLGRASMEGLVRLGDPLSSGADQGCSEVDQVRPGRRTQCGDNRRHQRKERGAELEDPVGQAHGMRVPESAAGALRSRASTTPSTSTSVASISTQILSARPTRKPEAPGLLDGFQATEPGSRVATRPNSPAIWPDPGSVFVLSRLGPSVGPSRSHRPRS